MCVCARVYMCVRVCTLASPLTPRCIFSAGELESGRELSGMIPYKAHSLRTWIGALPCIVLNSVECTGMDWTQRGFEIMFYSMLVGFGVFDRCARVSECQTRTSSGYDCWMVLGLHRARFFFNFFFTFRPPPTCCVTGGVEAMRAGHRLDFCESKRRSKHTGR